MSAYVLPQTRFRLDKNVAVLNSQYQKALLIKCWRFYTVCGKTHTSSDAQPVLWENTYIIWYSYVFYDEILYEDLGPDAGANHNKSYKRF